MSLKFNVAVVGSCVRRVTRVISFLYPVNWLRGLAIMCRAQPCPTLCDPMDCSAPGSSVRKSLQARIPEWVAISPSRGSSRPRDQTWVSRVSSITGIFFAC